ncbi:hypothetical protein [Maritalea sp.]|uniref:hypothetical protein n=1 Tax=Maritalea sp. TaxID=2003361 RepID=UPI003EF92159
MSKKTDLAEQDKQEAWPNAIASPVALDSALEEGLNSGASQRTTEEIFESAIARLQNG